MEPNAQTPPSTQSTQNTQSTPPKSLNKKWVLITVLLLILMAVFTAGAYLFGKSQTSVSKETVSITTESDVKPTAETKPTNEMSQVDNLNWKTYAGKYFSIRYPDEWIINDQSYNVNGDKYTGLVIQGPARTDIKESNGEKANYIYALKWDSSNKALIPVDSYGKTGEQFIFTHLPGMQEVTFVNVTDEFIKNSTEHNIANQILLTFKLTE